MTCLALLPPDDSRSRSDRRRRPTPMFSRYSLLGGRRRAPRRGDERDGAFVDVHGTQLFLAVTGIVVLNFLDAWFTVLFLSYGGTELNPFVDEVLKLGTWPFLLSKSVGIGLCVAVLTVTKNFRMARVGLGIVLGGYSLLLCWHLFLLQRLPTFV